MDRTISHQQINQRAFLGAALMDPAGAYEYILKLTPGMFDEGACRDTFAAIQRLTFAGDPVDPVTVVNMATSATLSADDLKRNIMQMAETCPSNSWQSLHRTMWALMNLACLCRAVGPKWP